MNNFLPTVILRHCKEKIKKCSLRWLEDRYDLKFFSYPQDLEALTSFFYTTISSFSQYTSAYKTMDTSTLMLAKYVLLDLRGSPLSIKDQSMGLLLLDGTWKYAKKMFRTLSFSMELRSIPHMFRTAYPRTQNNCEDPIRGLSSVETIFIAHHILKKDTADLLNTYYWKDLFLKKNQSLWNKF